VNIERFGDTFSKKYESWTEETRPTTKQRNLRSVVNHENKYRNQPKDIP
jgi:hypothetical protein